jgi:hypothetical protein
MIIHVKDDVIQILLRPDSQGDLNIFFSAMVDLVSGLEGRGSSTHEHKTSGLKPLNSNAHLTIRYSFEHEENHS